MNLQKLTFHLIFVLILAGSVELFSRIYLSFCGYPFFRPSEYLYTGFYNNMQELRAKKVTRGGATKNILILGGSVVSTVFSRMESRLDTILQKHYGNGKHYKFYNIASPGHTSLDNALKYSLLEDKRFDLVIYYKAITDMESKMLKDGKLFCDFCHVSEAGAQRFAHEVVEFIIRSGIL